MVCCVILYCIVLYVLDIVLYSIVLCCIVLYCIVLCCVVLYCIVLYCIVLYCIVCIVLCCIVIVNSHAYRIIRSSSSTDGSLLARQSHSQRIRTTANALNATLDGTLWTLGTFQVQIPRLMAHKS